MVGKCRHFLYGVIAVLLVLNLTPTACAPGPTPTPGKAPAPAPAPEPESELALYEAYKAIETRLDAMATNSEAQRYLADFMDLTEGMWQIDYVREYQSYYVRVQELTDSDPNTYYYKAYWRDITWTLDSNRRVSPDSNARRVEADLQRLSEGGVVEPNPNYSP